MNQPSARVYEYVDADGVVYWSFTRHPMTISPPKRLVLQDRKGTMLGHFLVQLRLQGMAIIHNFTHPPEGQ
jgi:hypothetical protein